MLNALIFGTLFLHIFQSSKVGTIEESKLAEIADSIIESFFPARALNEFVLYKQLPPIAAFPSLGRSCFISDPPRSIQKIRLQAGGRFVISFSSMESLHHGGNFARTLVKSLSFPDESFFVVPDFPCADIWFFRSFPPRNFRGVLVFSDAERNFQVSGFPFLPLYPWVVYLGNKLREQVFARQFCLPFGSSHLAQRRNPGAAATSLMMPSATRVPLSRKSATLGYLAHNCVAARDRAFARLCERLEGDCTALGRCPRGEKSDERRYDAYYLDEAAEMFEPYKFALVFENALTEGYVTEKIVNAFLAGAVPIYAGDKSVIEIFDRRSFVYVEDVDNDDWLFEVANLAKDVVQYEKMRNIVPVLESTDVFSWRAEVGNHSLGRAIVETVRELADQATRQTPIDEQMKLAESVETLLATTEFPGGQISW
jgi:hypothetical protein